MNRRDVLRATGVVAAGGIAGCGGASVEGDDPTDTAVSTTGGARSTTESDAGATTTATTPPSMGTPELTVGGSDCLSGEGGATVTFGEGEVTVEGTVAAPNPCYSPELSASDYDPQADELSLTVAAVRDTEEGQVCVTCVGGIRYTATVPFESGLPGRVVITHDGTETVTAAEASRGE